MTQFIIDTEGSCFDVNGAAVPRLIGPFHSRKDADEFATSIIHNGSWTISPLTPPALAKALADDWVLHDSAQPIAACVCGRSHACPECTTGKHDNCDGNAWCNSLDATALCRCAHNDHRPPPRPGNPSSPRRST